MPSRFGGLARLRIRTDVEADDDRTVDARKHDVVLGNRADAAVDRAHTNLRIGELFKRLLNRLDRTLHVGLDDDVEVLNLALLQFAVQIFERGRGAVLDHRRAGFRGALLDNLTASFSSATAMNSSPASGHAAETDDLHRVDGVACFTRSPRLETIARIRPYAFPATTMSPTCACRSAPAPSRRRPRE